MSIGKLKSSVLNKFIKFLKVDTQIDVSSEFGAFEILENQYGHARSREIKQSVDKSDQPLPWFTYPAIEYLRQLDLTEKIVLEWGAGNSSLFFSKISKLICSIEHNKDWYQAVLSLNISNQKLLLMDESKYVEAIKEFNQQFDIIVIDGILREKCARISLEYIKNNGLIILDNSDRDPQIAEYLRRNSLIEVDMHGFGPINDYAWTTSFFFKREFNFNPLGDQPTIPIGGGF